MALTPAQQAENDRINAAMLASQQAKRDATNIILTWTKENNGTTNSNALNILWTAY